jgi:hypothetical protein
MGRTATKLGEGMTFFDLLADAPSGGSEKVRSQSAGTS